MKDSLTTTVKNIFETAHAISKISEKLDISPRILAEIAIESAIWVERTTLNDRKQVLLSVLATLEASKKGEKDLAMKTIDKIIGAYIQWSNSCAGTYWSELRASAARQGPDKIRFNRWYYSDEDEDMMRF